MDGVEWLEKMVIFSGSLENPEIFLNSSPQVPITSWNHSAAGASSLSFKAESHNMLTSSGNMASNDSSSVMCLAFFAEHSEA